MYYDLFIKKNSCQYMFNGIDVQFNMSLETIGCNRVTGSFNFQMRLNVSIGDVVISTSCY